MSPDCVTYEKTQPGDGVGTTLVIVAEEFKAYGVGEVKLYPVVPQLEICD